MSTLKLTNTRRLLLVPLFAAFAVHAQASQAADSVGDTQARVSSVLEGARSHTDSSELRTTGDFSRASDVQESTRQVLLGTSHSNADGGVVGAGSSAASVADSSAAGNRRGGDEVQKLTQRVVLGRAAS